MLQLNAFRHHALFYGIISALAFIVLVMLTLLIIGVFLKKQYSAEAQAYFDSDFLTIAQSYQRVSILLFVVRQIVTFVSMALLFMLVLQIFSNPYRPSVLTALIVILAFFVALIIITFIFSFYRGFIVEHRFGLSNHTVGSWLSDYLKSQVISLLINMGAFTGLYALIKYMPRYWWLISWAAIVVFIIIGTYVSPVLIDPLFYKFKPLHDHVLKGKVLELADDAEIKVRDVLVADASTKTKKANAYFTGVGATKRIVLYDNLIKDFSHEQTLAVVAHEMAHWKYAHIVKAIAIALGFSFAAMLFLGYIIKGLDIHDIRGVFLVIILFHLLSFAILPAQNAISRRFEVQADKKAQILTADYKTQVDLSVDLSRSNLAMVEPHKIIRTILYSHPSSMERINNAITWEKEYNKH
jgi:STE24 endopeptidase